MDDGAEEETHHVSIDAPGGLPDDTREGPGSLIEEVDYVNQDLDLIDLEANIKH